MVRFFLANLAIAFSLMLSLLVSAQAHPVQAQAGERCFRETNQCLRGRFLQYWEQNGGLAVFGLPVTAAHTEPNRDTGKTYLTQWFERNRFELHPENAAPYDVLLGRLGDDRFVQQGLRWQDLPRDEAPRSGCLWFAQTQRNVCDQGSGVGFKSYWQSHGIQDAQLDAYGKSLALFGLPLTGARPETNSSGEKVITQWFERARFEWHPDKPHHFKVLLGLVGNEAHTAPQDTTGRAMHVLFAYFSALNDGRYSAASQLYGGAYDMLYDMNPTVAHTDHAGLLRAACTVNGFACLRASGIMKVTQVTAHEYRMVVQFAKADGSPFVGGADGERHTEFDYTVRLKNNRFQVMDLPVYVP